MSSEAGDIWYTLDGSDPRLPGSGSEAGDELLLVPEGAAKTVLVPTGPVDETWRGSGDFDDSDWIAGTGGVGYEGSTGYEQYFDIDVRSTMYGRNASCYIRIPFTLSADDLEKIGSLTLNARYDDGFIAYLNGAEVQRVMFGGDASWDSQANGNHSDIDAIDFEPFNFSASSVDLLREGENILAIQGLNAGSTSSDFLMSVTLTASEGTTTGATVGVAATALRYSEPVTLPASTRVKARLLSGTTWSALNGAVFSVGAVSEGLRISELMYHPAGDPNAEYIELTNVGSETINLNLVRFSEGVDLTFSSVALAPGEYALVVRDITAFENRYGADLNVVGQYEGSLNNGGERVVLEDATGQVICDLDFSDGWYDITDGLGFSLTVKAPASTTGADWEAKSAWRPSAQAGGSPGYDDSGEIVALGSVVINELLANSTGGTSDWIELYNTTDAAIDISGWFLSDDEENLQKYTIPAGTILAAQGYVVIDEAQGFGQAGSAAPSEAFGLSRQGETVYLHSGGDGVLTGYSVQEKFDASPAGVSLGRYGKSTGTYNFVALSEPTPGQANAGPAVGPVVISEIMYHPSGMAAAEYVELVNIGSHDPVTLYDTSGLGVGLAFHGRPRTIRRSNVGAGGGFGAMMLEPGECRDFDGRIRFGVWRARYAVASGR